MKKIIPVFVLSALILSGCSLPVSKYEAGSENVKTLMAGSFKPVAVGEFKSIPETRNPTSIFIRSMFYTSPYEGGFAEYLEEALRLELMLADKYDSQAEVVVEGVLLKNNLNSVHGTGVIEATFSVVKNGEKLYTRTVLSMTYWPTSFVGAVAITNAGEAYSPMVRSLLKKLYADPAFFKALKGEC